MLYYKDWYVKPLIRLNDIISTRLRSSRLLTKLLFGVNVTEGIRKQYWDYTTLVLKKALSEFTAPNQKILEIGVGDNAILSIFLVKRFPVSVTGVDIVPQVVVNAKKNVVRNSGSIDIRESDIFSNVKEKFDIIFWNLPYVPRDAQLHRKTTNFADASWDGGADGTDLLCRFIAEAPPFLQPNGKLLLGVNTFYISITTMYEIINKSSFVIEKVVSYWPNPSKVFVLNTKNQ